MVPDEPVGLVRLMVPLDSGKGTVDKLATVETRMLPEPVPEIVWVTGPVDNSLEFVNGATVRVDNGPTGLVAVVVSVPVGPAVIPVPLDSGSVGDGEPELLGIG